MGAPYHPATNGITECMVQSFRKSLGKSSLSPKRALQEFFMQYRRTPLALSLSPCELLNDQQICTKLDALLPSPAHVAHGKPATEANKAQQREQNHPILGWYILKDGCTLLHSIIVALSETGNHNGFQPIVRKVSGTQSVYVCVLTRGPTW